MWTSMAVTAGVGLLLLNFMIVSGLPMSRVDGQFSRTQSEQGVTVTLPSEESHADSRTTHAHSPTHALPSSAIDTDADRRQTFNFGAKPSIKTLADAGGFRFRVSSTPHPNSIDSWKEQLQLLDDESVSDDHLEVPASASVSPSGSPPTISPSLQTSTIKLIKSEDNKQQEIPQQFNAIKNPTDKDKEEPITPEPVLKEQVDVDSGMNEEQVAESTQNSQTKSQFLHRLQGAGILVPVTVSVVAPSTPATEKATDFLVKPPPPFTPELRQSSGLSSGGGFPFFDTYSYSGSGGPPLSILGEFHRGNYFTI